MKKLNPINKNGKQIMVIKQKRDKMIKREMNVSQYKQ